MKMLSPGLPAIAGVARSGRVGFPALLLGLFAVLGQAAELALPPASGFPRIPPVNAAKALEGRSLVESLRRGGYVLYVRHAETGEVTQTCDTSNLTAKGRETAAAIGRSMRTLGIPVDKAVSSEVCRVVETAKLMAVAPVETDENLHRVPKRPDHAIHEARRRLIATPPPPGTNRLLAGHMQQGALPEDRLYLDLGEVVVFLPSGPGTADVVARIRADEWAALLAAAQPASQDGPNPASGGKSP